MVKAVIDNVSDTARWVAEYRARESARPDALFHDPLAAGLSGERGRLMAEAATRSWGNGWFFVARTKLIDDMVMECVARGCDRVVNLAAGMDTRPYRLDLPSTVEWTEVDLPALVAAKDRELAGESPRCRLTRVPVDLTDAAARRRVLGEAVRHAERTLVITEGLLVYLDEPEVRALSGELAELGTRWWVADIVSPAVVRLTARSGRRNNAPVTFGPANGVGFFERDGWTPESVRPQLAAAAAWHRLPPFLRLLARLPQPDPRRPGRVPWAAVVRLGR